jgi:hypothetical protein
VINRAVRQALRGISLRDLGAPLPEQLVQLPRRFAGPRPGGAGAEATPLPNLR